MTQYLIPIFLILNCVATTIIIVQTIRAREKHTCLIKVRSLHTNYVYNAYAYRIKQGAMEIRIYNNFVDNFEWHIIWDFYNSNDIMAYLNAAYVREHYGYQPRIPRTNDFSHKKTSQTLKNLI